MATETKDKGYVFHRCITSPVNSEHHILQRQGHRKIADWGSQAFLLAEAMPGCKLTSLTEAETPDLVKRTALTFHQVALTQFCLFPVDLHHCKCSLPYTISHASANQLCSGVRIHQELCFSFDKGRLQSRCCNCSMFGLQVERCLVFARFPQVL